MVQNIVTRFASKTKAWLKKARYVNVFTTLCTLDGPAVGSIWLDIRPETSMDMVPVTVDTVDSVADGKVTYTDGNWDDVSDFIEFVRAGHYVLVGIQSDPSAIIVTHGVQ